MKRPGMLLVKTLINGVMQSVVHSCSVKPLLVDNYCKARILLITYKNTYSYTPKSAKLLLQRLFCLLCSCSRRILTETETELISQKRFNELVEQQKKVDAEIDAQLSRREEDLRLEEEVMKSSCPGCQMGDVTKSGMVPSTLLQKSVQFFKMTQNPLRDFKCKTFLGREWSQNLSLQHSLFWKLITLSP